eukprot:7696135-Pyramimonas_sp.AAC.1
MWRQLAPMGPLEAAHLRISGQDTRISGQARAERPARKSVARSAGPEVWTHRTGRPLLQLRQLG